MNEIDPKHRLWKRDDTVLGFKPKVKMRCPMCGAKRMELKFGNIFRFTLKPETEKPSRDDSFAMDIWATCQRCFYTTVHGVPLHISEYLEKTKQIMDQAVKDGTITAEENKNAEYLQKID
jgi:hypothetical protein